MPLYSIQAPNGQTYEIEGPEGATQDQVIAEILRRDPSAGTPAGKNIQQNTSAGADIFTALKQGAVGSAKALTDIFGAENAASSFLGSKAQELQQQYSPAAQAELRQQAARMKAAEASGSTLEEIKAAVQNIAEAPLRSTAQGVGSLAPYIPTMFLGPMAGALKLAPRTVAAIEAIGEAAPKVLGTAQGVGAVKGSIYDAVYQNELEATGNETVAKNKAQAAQNYVGKNIDQMIVGGVLGRIAGGTGAEKLLTKAGVAEASERLLPRLGRAAGQEFVTEGPQGAQERLAQNLALQREGVNVPTMQGVVGQGVQEGVLGALSAGPVAGLRGPDMAARRQEEERKRAEEARKLVEEAAYNSPEAVAQREQERLAALESEAAGLPQPTASRVLPSDIGDFTVSKEGEAQAKPYQLTDVARLMHNYDLLRNQVGELETQLAAGPDVDTQTKLMEQRGQMMARMQDMAPAIEERGGVTDTEADFTKRMQDVEKERLRLLELGDFDAAAKQAEKLKALQARQPYLQELKDFRTKAGQTRDLFAEEPAQPEAEGLKYVNVEGEPVQTLAATKEQATSLPQAAPAQQAAVQTAQTKLAQAEAALPAAAKSGNTETLYPVLQQISEAQAELSRANEDFGRPAFKPAVLDLFSPANLFNTALQSGDTKLINDLAKHSDTTALREALDTSTSEREKLVNVLESRLDQPGMQRQRADLFSKQYNPKQQALFKNGTYPDKELQAIYDKGGPAAVEYENVMRAAEALSKKVTTKQGNAKQSLYEQLVRTYAELEQLNAQMESGIATPTMREKVATAQAKLGKGEAPAERQMDAGEKYQLQRRIDATTNKYNMIVGKITPIRDQILALHNSLYTTTPLEKPSVVAEKQKKQADEAAKGPKAITRTARTAARLARGDVRREAETSEKMRALALELGQREPEFKKFSNALTNKLDALTKRYGAKDSAVNAFRASMGQERIEKALELGRQTPEYKATLKEQVEFVRGALSQSKQEVPTKRTGAVTRKQSAAPKRLVTSSPESRRLSEEEYIRLSRIKRDFDEAVASEKNPISFRLREDKKDTVVDAGEAQALIDGVKLPDNVKFVYAPTTGKIPVRLLNMMAKEGVDPTEGMVQGAVFPDGTVLVVGDQHADLLDLEQTIAHEIIGHYGIDTVIGVDRLNSFAKKTDVIDLAEKLGGKALVSEVLNTVRANADMGRSEEIQKLQALREIIAHTEEARVTEAFREKAGRWLKELVGMVRAGLRAMGFTKLPALSTSDVFYMLKQSRKAFENKTIGAYRAADGNTAFRLRRQPSTYSTIGREPGVIDTLLGNVMGLAGRVQYVDQYAALSEAFKRGKEKGLISSLEALNANFLLRFGQQRSQYAGQFLTNGPVKAEHTKKEGGVETIYRSTKGVSMVDVAQSLHESKIANDTELEDMFTLFVAGKRADQVGWDKLNFESPSKAKAEYADVLAKLNADPKAKAAFDKAAKQYQEYNAGLLDFLVGTGALSAGKAAELKSISYVPFYRINGDGDVQLMIDKEKSPIRIANIKDQPQLKELVGGNKAILPIFTSAAQNTFMLTGMGLRNQAVKETAFVLKKLGIASRLSEGQGPSGPDVVRFFKHGQPYHVVIDTDQMGIPADLIVKGMEGIKTTMPAIIKAMAIPSNILRSFVVRMPTYAVRQVVRDPLNAWLTTGMGGVPVLSSMKELATMVAGRSETERKLMETGAISSNVYSGDEQDMAKFLKDVSAGKSMWDKAIARLDAIALQGDAATRAVVYKDSLAKGMSEQEALLRTLESMNFSRRGVSPSMQALSMMIPFFNAQIQGLDVLWRAYKGDMPGNEQLNIKAKMIQRGLMLAAGTAVYAMLMQDDEAYKRAKPSEKYSNWFVYVPGVSEPVRVPIPFELGFLFKALPEAMWNAAFGDEKASKAAEGLRSVALQTLPNPVPQAIKPAIEAVLGRSFYTGEDIESARERGMMAQDRYRESTTELSKLIGSVTGQMGVSPIMLDHLIRGYTGALGVAAIQLANPLLASDTKAAVAQPTTKPSQTPLIGGLFQPVEGRGTLDEAYDRMEEIQKVKGSFNRLIEEGRQAEAKALAQQYSSELALASTSGAIQKRLGELAKIERIVKADPKMSTEQKDAKLKEIDKAKLAYARQFLAVKV